MAQNINKPAASAGHQIFTFLHSILLFVLDTLRRTLNAFSPAGRDNTHQEEEQQQQQQQQHNQTDTATQQNILSSSSSPQTHDRSISSDNNNSSSSNNNSKMVHPSLTSSGFRRQPTPAHSVPALPRIPARRPGSMSPDGTEPRLTARFSRLALDSVRGEDANADADADADADAVYDGDRDDSANDDDPHPFLLPRHQHNHHQHHSYHHHHHYHQQQQQQQQGDEETDGAHKGKENERPPVSREAAAQRAKHAAENVPVGDDVIQIRSRVPCPVIPKPPSHYSEEEKAFHTSFINEALDMARLALRTNETPVGCVIVYKGRIIAKGMNATNVTRNGSRHAELMAISALLSHGPESDLETKCPETPVAPGSAAPADKDLNGHNLAEPAHWGDVDPSDGHLFPYGQKLHPSPRVTRDIIEECSLYVTVEPCVMCASLLRQLRIKKVYFGAVNDKFGGTGGVFRIHQNSTPVRDKTASAPPSPTPQYGSSTVRPPAVPRTHSVDSGINGDDHPEDAATNQPAEAPKAEKEDPAATPPLEGDGGNIEPGYEAEGGWGRDEAVTLLRQFYVQENNRAPVPRKKEGRAARLAAIMERDGTAGSALDDALFVNQSSTESTVDESSDDQDKTLAPVEAVGAYYD